MNGSVGCGAVSSKIQQDQRELAFSCQWFCWGCLSIGYRRRDAAPFLEPEPFNAVVPAMRFINRPELLPSAQTFSLWP